MVDSHWLRKCLICLLWLSWPCGPCLTTVPSHRRPCNQRLGFLTCPSIVSAIAGRALCITRATYSHPLSDTVPSPRRALIWDDVQTTDDGDMPQEGRTHIQDGGDYPYGVPKWLKEQPELQRRGILLTDMLRPASIRITSLFLCN